MGIFNKDNQKIYDLELKIVKLETELGYLVSNVKSLRGLINRRIFPDALETPVETNKKQDGLDLFRRL